MAAITSFNGEFEFLSNFFHHPMPIRLEMLLVPGLEGEIMVPDVEHPYQAAKATSMEDALTILRLETPGKAKRTGRKIALRGDWENIKVLVMWNLVRAKFGLVEDGRYISLASRLLATGNARLIEGGTHDPFWGCCSCPKCVDNPGQNWLGRLLEMARLGLRTNLV